MFGLGKDGMAEFNRVTLRALEFRMSAAISEREILIYPGAVEVSTLIDEAARRVVMELSVFLAQGQRKITGGVERVKYHADWRQAFKDRWFHNRLCRWLLRKYPVRWTTKEIPVPIELVRVCPHLPIDKSVMRRGHIEFLMEPNRY